MKRRVSFHPDARWELREAVRNYEGEAAGLGAEFAAQVRSVVDRLLENPYTGAPYEAEA